MRPLTYPTFGLSLLLAAPLHADVSLPNIFGDSMVLQRDKPAPVWGKADPGETVTVTFAGASATATTDASGRWKTELPPLETDAVGKPLTVSGKNTIEIADVLVGDVWVGSGQSNMAWTVRNSDNASQEIKEASYPEIRLFKAPQVATSVPQDDIDASWTACTPDTVPDFSAVLYFFGRELHRELGVPVGLINSSWGGTRAEAWVSRSALESEAELAPILTTWADGCARYDPYWAVAHYQVAHERWKLRVAKAESEGKKRPRAPQKPQPCAVRRHHPSNLFNGMINPLIPFAIRGATWYQGEGNRNRAIQYRTLLPTLIGDWRSRWNQGDFPFLVVQLAGFQNPVEAADRDDVWAELQEAQFLTARNTPGVGLAVTNDIGDAKDIHPRNKQDVGKRLALWALHHTYAEEETVPSGPLFKSATPQGGEIRVAFDYATGLKSRDGKALNRFAIAGDDRRWQWANAEIEGEEVIVSHPDVPAPVAVRYAWAANPEGANLVNGAGLPASCFRSDDWPRSTRGNGEPPISYLKQQR